MSLSSRVADYIIKNKKIENKDQQEILTYGAEVLFGIVSGTVITLCVSYLLGLHLLVLFMLLVSLPIRKTAGGAHSDDPLNCLLITVLAYNLLAYSSYLTLPYIQDYLGDFVIATFIMGVILIYIKAPVDSPQKPLSLSQKKQLKKLAMMVLVITFILQIVTYHYTTRYLINYAVTTIILWQYLMLTSPGHYLILCLDKVLDFIRKRG